MFSVLILAALVLIIIDFDRSFDGLIQIDQETMVSLIRDLENAMGK